MIGPHNHLLIAVLQATAAMLLSDCSARQQAATDEVEKAKAQLQELQVCKVGFDMQVFVIR